MKEKDNATDPDKIFVVNELLKSLEYYLVA